MRKWVFIILSALVVFSCVQPLEEPGQSDAPYSAEGHPITIEFSVPGFSPATKALDEGGVLNTLHLAVFGGSGYLKEYVQAFPEPNGTYTYETTETNDNGESVSVSKTVPYYTFTATLALADSPRTIHIVGNGPDIIPFGYDTTVMPTLLSANGEMGYWQMISLPNGIRAKRNGDGNYVDKYGAVIKEDEGIFPDDYPVEADRGKTRYVADDETLELFENIALVRNWAKIVLSADEGSNFTPISLAAVNVPSRGAIAPYSAATGFIQNYETRDFEYLDKTVSYPANLPSGTSFDSTIPDAEDFTFFKTHSTETDLHNGVANANGGAVYLYERPAPTDRIPPSFVIIYGHYKNTEDLEHEGDYYYKVDLMETTKEGEGESAEWTSRYYPIFRNFKYKVVVKKILSQGQNSPVAAAASAGSADVSADVTTGQLSDISDGMGRLHISPWMSKTFIRSTTVTELSAFFSRSADGEADMTTSAVKVELLPPADGGADNIISDLSIGAPYNPDDYENPDFSMKGWRPITFKTAAPGRTVRRQSIRITGTHEYGRLYRDVEITIQPIQPMSVICSKPRIASTKGAEQTVTINIPDGLGASMFPLIFTIEAERMTLTPDNSKADNNLPVISGTSISENADYAGKTAFQYVRTLTWEEYVGLERFEDDEEVMWRSIPAYFKTNRDDSATTVWVYNEFFDKTSASFTNFNYKYFKNLAFTDPIPEETDREIHLQFEMIKDPDGIYPSDYPEVLIAVRGLRCTTEGIERGPTADTYVLKPSDQTVNLTFLTTTNDADIAVDLSATDYEDGHVEAYRFPYLRLLDGHPLRTNNGAWANSVWSNVAWGYVNNADSKTVLFGYKDHPDKLNTPVTVTLSGLKADGKTTYSVTPSGPRNAAGDENYHEIEMRTVGGTTDVTLSLSSPGYVTENIRAGRFVGNIRTMRIGTGNVFKSGNTYGFNMQTPEFDFSEDNGKCHVQFSSISADPNNGVTLKSYEGSSRSYTVSIKSLDNSQYLMYVNMMFKVNKSTVYAPASFTNISSGTIQRYYGSNNQYVWSIPRGEKEVSVTLNTPADADIVLQTLYVKAFNGTLYEGGQNVPFIPGSY